MSLRAGFQLIFHTAFDFVSNLESNLNDSSNRMNESDCIDVLSAGIACKMAYTVRIKNVVESFERKTCLCVVISRMDVSIR